LVAGGVLLASAPDDGPPAPPTPPPNRIAVAAAWPDADRATLTGTLPDGAVFVPGHFLDARTAAGTAASPDGRSLRLVIRRADGSSRQLRKVPAKSGVAFGSYVSSDTDLVWAESTGGAAPHLWAASLRDPRSPARRLTTDTGTAVLHDSPYDLVVNGGRVHWAAVPDGGAVTEIRSVPVSGGPVSVRKEPGTWTLSAWPWLTDGSDQSSVARLRNLATNGDVEVTGSGTELLTCGPAWCRVTVVGTGGISRVDLMRHDGSARQSVAEGGTTAVGTDVAVLDRFELLFAPAAATDRDNRAALLVHEIAAGRTVEVSPAVDGAFSRAGVLWWSTGAGDTVVWHSLDLRTV
jgi:hypothetical protein